MASHDHTSGRGRGRVGRTSGSVDAGNFGHINPIPVAWNSELVLHLFTLVPSEYKPKWMQSFENNCTHSHQL